MGASQDACEKSSSKKRLLENGYSNSCSAMFKKRKVSAVRVFPPGCGRNAPRMYVLPHIGKEERMANNKPMNVSVSYQRKMSEVGDSSLLHKLVTIPLMDSLIDKREDSMEEKLLEIGTSNSCGTLFKKRKVSATRVFPLGCGRNAPCMYVNPHFEKRKIATDKKNVNVSVNDCCESSLDRKVINEAVVKNVDALENKTSLGTAKKWTPPQGPVINPVILKESSLEKKYPERRISAMRTYPPFCGRNAPRPTNEERFEIMEGNKSSKNREKIKARERGSLPKDMGRKHVEVNSGGLDEYCKKGKVIGVGASPQLKMITKT